MSPWVYKQEIKSSAQKWSKKRYSYLRTKMIVSYFPKWSSAIPCLRQAGVRRELFTLFIEFPPPAAGRADGFSLAFHTQGFDVSSAERRRFGSFLPSRSFGMPWAILYWPFRPDRRRFWPDLCIKSSFMKRRAKSASWRTTGWVKIKEQIKMRNYFIHIS